MDQQQSDNSASVAGNMTAFPAHILVVEADEPLTEMMAELLGREGCLTSVATTLDEAVVHLAAGAVEAVILDIDTVPLGLDEAAVTVLRAWLRGSMFPPPFILLSVHVPPDVECRTLPILSGDVRVEWIRKPFRKGHFLSVIQRATRLKA